ncbi:MFS transporter [Streptomyces sp. NPDC085937]|uniref:MFS transporter n=1 Tax=Streptomyces sp. NPDC085937 TaxID=3365742 RepID=UPI0037D2B35A
MNASHEAAAAGGRSRAAVVSLACAGVFVAYLPVTTVSVSLPVLQGELGASTAQLSWVQDAFVLPMAALILTAGVVGDVLGRKKVFQAGMALCAVGALVALCANSVQVVWAGQVLAGAGAAALLPVTLALISQAVPNPRERGKYIGYWTTCMMAAMVVGPLMAGTVVAHTGWRWIFLLPIPVALLTMGVAARLLTESKAAHARGLDWPGQVAAAVAITALVYGVIEGGATSFTAPRTLVALVVAVLSGAAFVLVERRSTTPMLDLSLFRSRPFTAAALVALVSFLGLIGFFFVLSLYLGMVQRLDTWDASLRLILVNVMSMVLGVVMGRVMGHVSSRVLITSGLLIAAAALTSMTTLDAGTPFWSLAWRLMLLGLGLGIAFPCITSTAVAAVEPRKAGMAAAGNNAFRQVGGALGPAVLGALLTTTATDALPGHLAGAGVSDGVAGRVVDAVRDGGLGAANGPEFAQVSGQVDAALSEAFLEGLRFCLTVSSVLLVVAAAAAVVLLRRRPEPSTPAGSTIVSRQSATTGRATTAERPAGQ